MESDDSNNSFEVVRSWCRQVLYYGLNEFTILFYISEQIAAYIFSHGQFMLGRMHFGEGINFFSETCFNSYILIYICDVSIFPFSLNPILLFLGLLITNGMVIYLPPLVLK